MVVLPAQNGDYATAFQSGTAELCKSYNDPGTIEWTAYGTGGAAGVG